MRRLAAVVAALVIALSAMAQSRVGVTGGFNTSGYHAGVTVYRPLGLGFAVQPSLVYAAKGSDRDINIELPVQIQAGLDLLLFRPYLFVEPFAGYVVNSDIENCLEYGFGLGGGLHLGRSFQLSAKYFWNFDNNVEQLTGVAVSAAILF